MHLKNCKFIQFVFQFLYIPHKKYLPCSCTYKSFLLVLRFHFIMRVIFFFSQLLFFRFLQCFSLIMPEF